MKSNYGIAVDLGTTTVAVMLWDLDTGRLLGKASDKNRQSQHGADIVTRQSFRDRKPGNEIILKREAVDTINSLVGELCEDTDSITRVVLAGNTVMTEFFGDGEGLAAAENAEIITVPAIGGFVGGDVTAGLIATDAIAADAMGGCELTLFMDIGTNGELVLAGKDMAMACSTAAGPAFGRAGLLGSGMIDAVGELLRTGDVDRTGRYAGQTEQTSQNITQKHIRDFQLAKGAVATGVEMLLKKAERKPEDLKRVVIAGVFGSNIDAKNAIETGLIKGVDESIIEFAGNAAGDGASMILLDEDKLEDARKIAGNIQHVELANEPEFQEIFLRNLDF